MAAAALRSVSGSLRTVFNRSVEAVRALGRRASFGRVEGTVALLFGLAIGVFALEVAARIIY